jgi:hypothetical protein
MKAWWWASALEASACTMRSKQRVGERMGPIIGEGSGAHDGVYLSRCVRCDSCMWTVRAVTHRTHECVSGWSGERAHVSKPTRDACVRVGVGVGVQVRGRCAAGCVRTI